MDEWQDQQAQDDGDTVEPVEEPVELGQARKALSLAMRFGDSLLSAGMSANDVVVLMLRITETYGLRKVHIDVHRQSHPTTGLPARSGARLGRAGVRPGPALKLAARPSGRPVEHPRDADLSGLMDIKFNYLFCGYSSESRSLFGVEEASNTRWREAGERDRANRRSHPRRGWSRSVEG
jgi:hypothetical protein